MLKMCAAEILSGGRCDSKKSYHRHHRLLRAHRERPSGRRTTKRGYELSPLDVDGHVTLPSGSYNGGTDITPGRAALRDFEPAYVGLGHFPPIQVVLKAGPCPFRPESGHEARGR